MIERPIPFSDPMVRAVLAGTKRQTRRPVKVGHLFTVENAHGASRDEMRDRRNMPIQRLPEGVDVAPLCPYGQPGDRLWVRETWRIGCWDQETGRVAVDYRADGYARREWLQVPNNDVFLRLWQQSCDDAHAKGVKPDGDFFRWEPGQSPCRWRPPMFMFRWASRITLEVVSVRVERLNEIGETDALAEGMSTFNGTVYSPHEPEGKNAYSNARGAFGALWESINGPGSWDANPWVWVIEFRRVP